MESNLSDLSKQILKLVFDFYDIYVNYHSQIKLLIKSKNESVKLEDPTTVKSKLNKLLNEIKSKKELLEQTPNFKDYLNKYYREGCLQWKFLDKGVEKLFPICVYIFISEFKFVENGFACNYMQCYTICQKYTINTINELLSSDSSNNIILWKIITLFCLLTKPQSNITQEETNAISFSPSEPQIKLSEGISISDDELEPFQMNTEFISTFLTSNVLLEAYKTILNDSNKPDNFNTLLLEKENLKKVILDFLKEDSIYFVYQFPQHGLTLSDGSVLINYEQTINASFAACYIMTIFHEITHVLYRKVINNNVFRRSFDETKDSGTLLEQLLVGDMNKCHRKGCCYIINSNNYNTSVSEFKNKLNEIESQVDYTKDTDTTLYDLYKKTNHKPNCLVMP